MIWICHCPLSAPLYVLSLYVISALLDKCCPALRTADLYLSFASRNPDFLLASRTGIDMIILSLRHQIFLTFEKSAYLRCLVQESYVLIITLSHISGKHPEICINETSPAKQVKYHSYHMVS